MFKIYDGREHFYQWDLNRKLIVDDPEVKQVHFCNRTDNCSLVCETYVEDGLTVVNVPNILLQSDWKIRVYAYDGYHTKHDKCYDVKSRTKPSDYAYEETEILNYETMGAKIDATNKELSKKANSADVYNRKYVDAMLNLKANKSDVVNAYCFKGSIDTLAEMPFKWNFIPNGVPTIDGEPCGTYDEQTNTVTVTLDDDYYYGEVIFPIKPIILKETSSYYFCDNLYYGLGYIGDYLFHVYDCADAYGASYQTLTKGTVIDKVIVEECYSSGSTNNLGTLYKGYKTWYYGDDYDEDGILDYEYPYIPYDAFANGAVYNVIENEVNYAWTGEGWDALGGNHIDTEAREEIEKLKTTTANVLKGSASGEAVGITDIAPNEHIIDVKLSSKNIINADDLCGKQFTKNDDGSYTFTMGSGNNRFTTMANIFIPKGSKIVFSITGFESDNVALVGIQTLYANGTYLSSYDVKPGYLSNRAIKTEDDIVGLRLYLNQGTTEGATVKLTGIQLEYGTKVTTYAPCVDVSQATLSATGKNLFNKDFSLIKSVTYKTAIDGEYVTKPGFEINLPCGTYTIYTPNIYTEKETYIYGGVIDKDGIRTQRVEPVVGKTYNKVTFTISNGEKLIMYIGGQNITEAITKQYFNYFDFQLEVGESATSYEPYKEPTSYKPMADGTVEDVVSIYPNTTLTTDTQGVLVEAEYNRDLNKAFAELQQAIISLGGNI